MEVSNFSVTEFPIGMCVLLNLPETKRDCSIFQDNPNCVYCPHTGKFLTGEGMNEDGLGHFISRIIGGMTIFIGICAIFMSCLIITILRRQNTGKSFDILLSTLALFDLLASLSAVITAGSMIVFFQNWSRNLATVASYLVGLEANLFAKSGSSFITVAIAVERYVAIVFPFKKVKYFTARNTYFLVVFICLWSCLLAMPRFAGVYIGENTIGRGISSIEDLDYVIYGTKLGIYAYVEMKNLHDQIDYWLPLLSLITLTALTYHHIRKFFYRRDSTLNVRQSKELNAGKMFTPVVIVFFLSNIAAIVVSFNYLWYEIVYREGILAILLSSTINSAANLPIYYLKASRFRKEAKTMWRSCMGKIYGNLKFETSVEVVVENGSKSGASELYKVNEHNFE